MSTTNPNSPALAPQADFEEITALISAARQRAVQAVNTTLIELYWQVGQTISRKIAQAQWGDGVVAWWRGGAAGRAPGPHPAGAARFYHPQPVPDAAVLRGLPGR